MKKKRVQIVIRVDEDVRQRVKTTLAKKKKTIQQTLERALLSLLGEK